MRRDNKTGIRDSLEKVNQSLYKISNSKYWIGGRAAKLQQNSSERTGVLKGLNRMKQFFLDTIEDFDGEDMDVLTEVEAEEWNLIIAEIKSLEQVKEDGSDLLRVYKATSILLEEDESELLNRKRKLENKLYGDRSVVDRTILSPKPSNWRVSPTSYPAGSLQHRRAMRQQAVAKTKLEAAERRASRIFQSSYKKRSIRDFFPSVLLILCSIFELIIGIERYINNDILVGSIFLILCVGTGILAFLDAIKSD